MVNREERIKQEVYRLNEQFRNGAISIDEKTGDYFFITQIKYEPIGRPDQWH